LERAQSKGPRGGGIGVTQNIRPGDLFAKVRGREAKMKRLLPYLRPVSVTAVQLTPNTTMTKRRCLNPLHRGGQKPLAKRSTRLEGNGLLTLSEQVRTSERNSEGKDMGNMPGARNFDLRDATTSGLGGASKLLYEGGRWNRGNPQRKGGIPQQAIDQERAFEGLAADFT